MSSVTDKEALGDWNNLKGTRYHLVYALWLLLRKRAQEVHFYKGNDLLAKPTVPPDLDDGKDEVVATHAKGKEGNTDVWIQLKATRSPWTVSALLEENLLFNFVCNAAVSEHNGRSWRVELVTESDVRREEIRGVVVATDKHRIIYEKLTTIIDRARIHLENAGGFTLSDSEVSDLAKAILLSLADTERLDLERLKAEVETVLALACHDAGSVRRIASTLVGAMLLDAGAGPEQAHPYTVEWVNREAGMAVISNRPFDTDVVGTCDLAVSAVTEAFGPIPFQADHYATRSRLHAVLQRFLEARECLFVLLGRSGTGKSWSVADWITNGLRGKVRILVPGTELAPGATLAQLAINSFERYTARSWRPDEILACLASAAGGAGQGPLLFAIDDLRVTTDTAESYQACLARLTRETREVGAKLLLTCQQEAWELFRLHAQLSLVDIYNPQRGLTSAPITSSITLEDFSPEELETALRQRLAEERAERAILHLRSPTFAPLRNPYLLERYLELHGSRLGHPSTVPDPVDIDRLLAATVDECLERVAATLATDLESVREAFHAMVDELWRGRNAELSSRVVVNRLAEWLPERGQSAFAAFRRTGLLTTGGAVRWVNGAVADHIYGRRLLVRCQERTSGLSELAPSQDITVAEAVVRMTKDGQELAEDLLRQDLRWRPAVAHGLGQRPPDELSTVALVHSLTRPTDERFVDADGCEALGTLAVRGRRGLHGRRAWRWMIEMYLSGDHIESLRGMQALAAAFRYAPRLVSRVVRHRVYLETRRHGRNPQRGLGRRLDDALGALHQITHREAALAARAVLAEIAPTATNPNIEDREKLLDTIDYLRGRSAAFLDDQLIENLLEELRAEDRTVRLRGATALRPAAYESPRRIVTAVVAAIRTETDPDVLLRLLWASHPFLAVSCAELLAALSASAVIRWDHPLPAGPALALLGEAAAYEPETVARMLPQRLDRLPEWARACVSDVHALAWWRCADRLPALRQHLSRLSEPDLTRIPRMFRVFLYRGAFVARLGLTSLGRISPFGFGISMTTHRDGCIPYCFSDLDDFMTRHAASLAADPELPRLADALQLCVVTEHQIQRHFRYSSLANARFICAREAVDDLCRLARYLSEPLSLLRSLPRDWQAIRAARLLLGWRIHTPAIEAFAQSACDEHTQSGTGNAFSERGLCLAQLARLHPVPQDAIDQQKLSPAVVTFRASEFAPRMSVLMDENPEQILALLERAIPTLDHAPLLFYWASHARSWRASLLSRAYRRTFSPRPISRTSAIRMVADVLSVVRSVPPSTERAEYETVYEALGSWLTGRRDVPEVVTSSASPIRRSHALAVEVLRRAALALETQQALDWQHGVLADSRYWWQSWHLKLKGDTLTMGSGAGIYLIYTLPAVRLACVVAGLGAGVVDPGAAFMNARYRVASELEKLEKHFWTHETRPDRLEQQLSHVRQLIATSPPDERLDLYAGNLLLRLGRLQEGEQSLRDCLSRPLCSELSGGAALYDLACVAARTDRPALCRELLEEAIRLLPQQRDQIAADPDFTSVSSTDWFKAMLPDKRSPDETGGLAQG
jgi:hypothetical protein